MLQLAQEEAQRFNHNYIGTEHLLLGLVREGEGIAAGVLESLGVNLEKVRLQVMLVVDGPGANPQQKLERPGRALRACAAAAVAALADECQPGPRSPLALQPGGPLVTPLVARIWQQAQSLAEESALIDSSHLVRALVGGPESAANVMVGRHRVTADLLAEAASVVAAAWRKRMPNGPLEAPGIVGRILDLAGEIGSEVGRDYVCTLDLLRAMLNTPGSLPTVMLAYAEPAPGSLRDEVDMLIAASQWLGKPG